MEVGFDMTGWMKDVIVVWYPELENCVPPPLYFEWNCGVASHPAWRHGIAVLNLFVCAGATHGVVAAKGCERPCSPRSAAAPAPAPARRPSVESPSDVTGYSLTLWLSR